MVTKRQCTISIPVDLVTNLALFSTWQHEESTSPMNQSMDEDFARAGSMDVIAIALSRFAESLDPKGQFVKEGRKWVYRRNNFVAVEVQPRKQGIMLTLYGFPAKFQDRAEASGLHEELVKRLEPDRAAYSRYPVRNHGQLLAAAQFIKWAFDHSNKQSSRKP
jgi:hypothetical protein